MRLHRGEGRDSPLYPSACGPGAKGPRAISSSHSVCAARKSELDEARRYLAVQCLSHARSCNRLLRCSRRGREAFVLCATTL
jgi:hypothetical protein